MKEDRSIFASRCLDLANQYPGRGTQTITLRPKAFAVPASLPQRPGQLVTKEKPFDEAWTETFVVEAF